MALGLPHYISYCCLHIPFKSHIQISLDPIKKNPIKSHSTQNQNKNISGDVHFSSFFTWFPPGVFHRWSPAGPGLRRRLGWWSPPCEHCAPTPCLSGISEISAQSFGGNNMENVPICKGDILGEIFGDEETHLQSMLNLWNELSTPQTHWAEWDCSNYRKPRFLVFPLTHQNGCLIVALGYTWLYHRPGSSLFAEFLHICQQLFHLAPDHFWMAMCVDTWMSRVRLWIIFDLHHAYYRN